MNLGTVRDVMILIQQGYGDNQMSSLDRSVATNIVNYFENKGYLTPEELALLVEAAGGEIRVSEQLITAGAPRLLKYRDEMNAEFVFQTKEQVVIEDASSES